MATSWRGVPPPPSSWKWRLPVRPATLVIDSIRHARSHRAAVQHHLVVLDLLHAVSSTQTTPRTRSIHCTLACLRAARRIRSAQPAAADAKTVRALESRSLSWPALASRSTRARGHDRRRPTATAAVCVARLAAPLRDVRIHVVAARGLDVRTEMVPDDDDLHGGAWRPGRAGGRPRTRRRARRWRGDTLYAADLCPCWPRPSPASRSAAHPIRAWRDRSLKLRSGVFTFWWASTTPQRSEAKRVNCRSASGTGIVL